MARDRSLSVSLPFTGRPFVEAGSGSPTGRRWWRSLPFTGRPFVEAASCGSLRSGCRPVAALHRAALR